MIPAEKFERLLMKWAKDAEECRAEAVRVERLDRDRHAGSITMLEASALTLERCIAEASALKE